MNEPDQDAPEQSSLTVPSVRRGHTGLVPSGEGQKGNYDTVEEKESAMRRIDSMSFGFS